MIITKLQNKQLSICKAPRFDLCQLLRERNYKFTYLLTYLLVVHFKGNFSIIATKLYHSWSQLGQPKTDRIRQVPADLLRIFLHRCSTAAVNGTSPVMNLAFTAGQGQALTASASRAMQSSHQLCSSPSHADCSTTPDSHWIVEDLLSDCRLDASGRHRLQNVVKRCMLFARVRHDAGAFALSSAPHWVYANIWHDVVGWHDDEYVAYPASLHVECRPIYWLLRHCFPRTDNNRSVGLQYCRSLRTVFLNPQQDDGE